MNLEDAEKIVNLVNDKNIHYYSEYINLCQSISNNNIISGSNTQNKAVNIILNAFRIVKKYKSNNWEYANKIQEKYVISTEIPICIRYKTKDGITKEQSVYNIEQLKRLPINAPLIKYRKIDDNLPYIHVSGGYSGLNPNFVYTKLNKQEQLSTEFESCIKILKNLIFRGCPTKPFETLRNHLKNKDDTYDFKQVPYYYFNIEQNLEWDGVIKGGAKDGLAYNPALTFYKKLNEMFPLEGKTFLPECPFIEVVNSEKYSKESCLDFYSPFFKIAVEIDGSQHKETRQKQKDEYRDSVLSKNWINTIRFDTNSLLPQHIEKIKNIIEQNRCLRIIKEPMLIDLQSAILFRFQIAIIEILEKGWIKEQRIYIKLHENAEINSEDFNIAYQDIKTSLYHLGVLAQKTFKLPDFEFILVDSFENNNGLKIDISVLDLYDQRFIREQNEKQITIRTDYFPYTDYECFDCSSEKNYYFVEYSDFRFKNVKYATSKISKQHDALLYFLQNLFGFKDFRPKQEEIVCKALNPDNGVIGLLPTGSGKSVCFQLVSLLTPGISLVVSPLKSLMNDQCNNLRNRHGITNSYQITSGCKDNLFLFLKGNSKLLYISPERFFNNTFRNIVNDNKEKISQIIVDEVHCLSEWGHDFRTSYLLLFNILKNIKFSNNLLVMGTTATASVRVTKDISAEFRKLGKVEELINLDTVSRPELSFIKELVNSTEESKNSRIVELVKNYFSKNEKTIIFVPYKRYTKELKNLIDDNVKIIDRDQQINSETFASGDSAEKVEKFKKNEIDVMVATKAFGMGLDVSDIRHTIHYSLSSSIEAIYQEMGRAGRDGKDATCHILFNDSGYRFKENPCENNKTLKELEDSVKEGDVLREQLFFISHEFTPKEEADFIVNILEFLQSDNVKSNNGSFSLEELKTYLLPDDKLESGFQSIFEKALYRLYSLGIIDLWDIDYSLGLHNPCFTGLTINKITISEILTYLNKYVNQYDLSKIYTINEFNKEEEIIGELSRWIYNHFFIYRWTSLKTLYEWLREKHETNKAFSDSLSAHFNNYFSKNENLDSLLLENPTDYNEIYKCLSSSSAIVLNDQISYKIKEDENNFALNLLSGLVRLRINDFDNYDGINRLEAALKIIASGSYRYGEKMYFFDEKYKTDFINMICVYLSDIEKIQFFIFLYEKFKSFFDLDIVQKRIVEMDAINKKTLINLLKYKRAILSLETIKNTLENDHE